MADSEASGDRVRDQLLPMIAVELYGYGQVEVLGLYFVALDTCVF